MPTTPAGLASPAEGQRRGKWTPVLIAGAKCRLCRDGRQSDHAYQCGNDDPHTSLHHFRYLRSLRGAMRPHYTPKLKKRTALLRQLKEVFRRYRSQPVERVISLIRPPEAI